MNRTVADAPRDSASFLEWEATQLERHVFERGEVFAISGASAAHNIVTGNLAATLLEQLKGRPCRVFVTNMRFEISKGEHYTYPDVFVTRDTQDFGNGAELIKRHPCFVAEVLSSATAYYDQGAKFAGYRSIETVEEVLFIHPEQRTLELFTRSANAPDWILHPIGSKGDLQLHSLGLSISVADLFSGLDVTTNVSMPL